MLHARFVKKQWPFHWMDVIANAINTLAKPYTTSSRRAIDRFIGLLRY